ncbi:MAG TPA: DNA-3-methyladenine glycosylase 2 family protein [Acidimicrobiia bacterium]|nr:DNA-3-methyladenine glycosylase 2 family protein [Acidimicrobiia bacterium]
MDDRAHHAAIDELISRDSDLAQAVGRSGRPGLFRRPPTFPSLVLFVLEQQVSLASAAATYRRLEERGPVTPEAVLHLDGSELRSIGVSRQKAGYVRSLATGVIDGTLSFDHLASAPDQEVRTALTALPGIGRWTADVFLLVCLGRPDVWPIGDRALQVGTGEVVGSRHTPTAPELEQIGERWRPLRSTAARIVWHDYLVRRGRSAP